MEKTREMLIEELRGFSTPELCDGMESYRVMDHRIKRMVSERNIVGTAFTIELPAGSSGCIPEAIKLAKKGDVLVIAGKGCCKSSYWGDYRSVCASLKELEAIVVDGAIRDIEGCTAIGIPVFAAGVTPKSGDKSREGKFCCPVICGDVEVKPGDFIIGDANGIIVIDPEDAGQVMENACKKREAEAWTISKMYSTGKVMTRAEDMIL